MKILCVLNIENDINNSNKHFQFFMVKTGIKNLFYELKNCYYVVALYFRYGKSNKNFKY